MNSSRLVIIGAALAMALPGCSSSDTVPKKNLEKEAQAQFDKISQQKGGPAHFPKITCPKDLKAKKGATTRCSASSADGTLGITVTVTGTKGGKAQLHFQVDDHLTK